MKILKKIPIAKNIYEGFYEDFLFVEFPCPNCNEIVHLDLLDDYQLLENLIEQDKLSHDLILKQGMAKLTSKFYKHLGLYTVYPNLPAYYKLFSCCRCKNQYIAIFGFGEAQAGRNLLYISGIWEIE